MKIAGINKNISSTEEGLGDRYLVFSENLTQDWKRVFLHNHHHSLELNKRSISFTGNQISVNCTMDELQGQIDLINSICQKTDADLLAAYEKSQREEQERVQLAQDKRARADAQYDKLKF